MFSRVSGYLTRREMLQAAAGLGIGLALEQSGVARDTGVAGSLSFDLGGDKWTLQQEGIAERIPAKVPGCTYTNLLAVNRIPDPFVVENSDAVQWVAEKNWFYEREFDVPREIQNKRHVELVCHGLDTLASVWLNGREIGCGDNMFRTWGFDIKPHLQRGTNLLRIRFDTLTPYVEKHREAYQKQYGIDLHNERSWVRKGPYMWGWDWCRPILTQGIWRKIELLGYDSRIVDLAAFQNHLPDGEVQLDIHAAVAGQVSGTTLRAQVFLAGNVVAEATGPVSNGEAELHATVHRPQLWWPNGMGNQPLYTVTANLVDAQGKNLDSASRRVGLRRVEVLPPQGDVGMHLRVNGVPVFAKGADWIPADNMPTRVTPEILRWYMTKAVECNFNFIRLWGGGYYEEDELFDLCDEMGLMLQFEFKFANASYPVNDSAWMDNLRVEIEEQTRRCRNHPSIVIWSGNNEIGYFEGYDQLFKDLIGGIVERLAPGVFYEVGSGAHGSGDIHTWSVWHENKPVESFSEIKGFVTEFGMQSTPVPMTVRAFTDPDGPQNVDSSVMRYHELDASGEGIRMILQYTEEYFGKAPEDFDDTLWLTDINQAWAMRYGVEYWRRDMPRSMAAAIWQYNDCWPGSSWAMVDYFRRWKAVLYQSKHFFAPILVSGVLDTISGRADIWVTSDRQEDVSAGLLWSVTTLAGEVVRHGSKQFNLPARTSLQTDELDLSDLVKAYGATNLLVWPEVVLDGQTVAKNTLFFGRPKSLKLKEPKFMVHTSGGEQCYRVAIDCNIPALWLWVNVKDTDASYSDNFVDLFPGRAAEIEIMLDKPMKLFDFQNKLAVRSIYEIAPEMRG